MKSSLDRRLRALILDFGKRQVEQALAKLENDDAVGTPKRHANARRPNGKSASTPRRSTKLNRHIQLACLCRPESEASLKKLGLMFQENHFLNDSYEVQRFLHENGVEELPSSRPVALKLVMKVLAGMSVAQIGKTLKNAIDRHEIGDFRMLANAIMGVPNRNSN
jgi:hypothetical protein